MTIAQLVLVMLAPSLIVFGLSLVLAAWRIAVEEAPRGTRWSIRTRY